MATQEYSISSVCSKLLLERSAFTWTEHVFSKSKLEGGFTANSFGPLLYNISNNLALHKAFLP